MPGRRTYVCALGASLLVLTTTGADAQVVRDGSIGPDASVQPVGPAFEITEAMGETAGASLFHSFSALSFGSSESVSFLSGANISNIFSRVTGGQMSMIDGLLLASATLYLINPAGLVFGPNATLSVSGSFYATTADYIEFLDGLRFDASPASGAVLSVAAPESFGFLSTNPGSPIVVEGDLLVRAGVHEFDIGLGLVGGPADIGSDLVATGGGVSDVTVRNGRIETEGRGIFINGNNIVLEDTLLQDDLGGSVTVAGQGDVSLKGTTIDIKNLNAFVFGTAPAGSVSIAGANITLTDDSSISRRDYAVADPAGRPAGIAITLTSPGRITVSESSLSVTRVHGEDRPNLDGGIFISGNTIVLEGASLSEIGNGSVAITGQGDVTVSGTDIELVRRGLDLASGNGGGGVSITGANINVSDGSNILTTGSSNKVGGRVTLASPGGIILSDSTIETRTGGTGSGAIMLTAADILLDGGTIRSSTSFGDSGSITLLSSGGLRLSAASVNTDSLAQGGDILLRATDIVLEDSRVSAAHSNHFDNPSIPLGDRPGTSGSVTIESLRDLTLEDSTVSSSNRGLGAAGNMTLTSGGTMRLLARSFLFTTASEGQASNIVLTAPDIVMHFSFVASSNFGSGDAGSIEISAQRLSVTADNIGFFDQAIPNISTTAATGAGGNIVLSVSEVIELVGALITTSVASGAGGGGNITIAMDEVGSLMLMEHSQLRAEANEGAGGNIDIRTALFIATLDPETLLSASSELGVDGQIDIAGPDTASVATVTTLPATFVDAAGLIRERCSASQPQSTSSFVVRGRGGVPPTPAGLLPTQPRVSSDTAAGVGPEYVGALVGTVADGRPVLLRVRCER